MYVTLVFVVSLLLLLLLIGISPLSGLRLKSYRWRFRRTFFRIEVRGLSDVTVTS